MRKTPAMSTLHLIGAAFLCCPIAVFPQDEDTSRTAILKIKPDVIVKQDTVKSLPKITMPQYRMAPIKRRAFGLDISNRTRAGLQGNIGLHR